MVANYLNLISLVLVLASSANPGVKIGIDQASITSLKDDVLPLILNDLANIQVSDLSTDVGTGFYKVFLTMTKIKCTAVNLDTNNTGVTLTPPDSVTITASGFTANFAFSWSYENPLGGDSGQGTVVLLPTTIIAVVKPAQIAGKPVVSVTSVNFQISDVKIVIAKSTIATEANWLLSLFKENILTALTQALNQYTGQVIDNAANQILSKYDTQLQVTETLAINYNLTSDPVITSQYIQVNLIGTFIDLTHPNETIDVAPPAIMPDFTVQKKDVQVYLSEYTLNTGLYAGITSDTFQGEVTPDTPGVGNYLTAMLLNTVFPGISAEYGANETFSLNCIATEPAPMFNASAGTTPETGSLSGTFNLDCGLIANTTDDQVIRIALGAAFETVTSVENWVLKMTLSSVSITSIRTYDSTLRAPVNDASLKTFLNLMINLIAPAALNAFIGNGLPLPQIRDVDMSDSSMTIENGYLAILATPVYNFTEYERPEERP